MKNVFLCLALLITCAAASAQTPCIGCGGGGSGSGTVSGGTTNAYGKYTNATTIGAPAVMSDDGTNVTSTGPIAAPRVSVNSAALGYPSGLAHFLNGSLVGKQIQWTGDSTVAVTTVKYDAMCLRTQTGQEFFGEFCAPNSQYSIDGSHNVTVTTSQTLPANCIVGSYVTITPTGTAQTNIVGSATETFQIATVPSTTSYTFNNPASATSISTTGMDGNSTCSFINNGLNGQTQAGFNSGSGVGSLAFVLSQAPALDIHRGMGINDVRLGTTSLATLTSLIKTYIDSLRSNLPNIDIILETENSILADDPTSTGLAVPVATTSSTAVGGAGSATITLAAMPTAISGLVTSDLTLAQEAANTGATGNCATTGSITSGGTALTVASGTTCYNGMMITVAGAGGPFVIISGGTTTSLVVAPQATATVSSVAVAQSANVDSAHLLVDTGAAQEICPITAINVAGSTVTCTFANAHSGSYTVTTTMATAAQAYSNIIHDAVMSFVGYAPNVLVFDTQTALYGRLVTSGLPWIMLNQLHPSIRGQNVETAAVARLVNLAKQTSQGQGSIQAATLPTLQYALQTQYSPAEALNALNNSYNSCWTGGYYQCVENPNYFTLVGSGALNSSTSGSFIRVNAEPDASPAVNATALGVIPCQPYDLVEWVGFGITQLSSGASCSLIASLYTQISTTATWTWTPPTSIPIRVYRAKYVDPTGEVYGREPLTYKSMSYVVVTNNSTTGFTVSILGANPNSAPAGTTNVVQTFNPATDKLVVQGVGDLSSIVGSYTSMTCSWTGASNTWLCTGGTNVPAMSAAYGQAFYTQTSETYARRVIATVGEMAPVDEVLSATIGTNLAGNQKTIRCGLGTGNTTPCITAIQGPALGTASGVTYQTNVNRVVFNDTKSLTSGSATTLVSTPLLTLQSTGGYVSYHLRATDGTNTCVLDGIVSYSAENSAGTFVTNTSNLGTAATACTAAGGTLSATFAVTSANPALLQITPTLSTMTATTFTIVYEVHTMGETNVTP